MPNRQEGDLAHDHGRKRNDAAPILVLRLFHVRNQSAVHPSLFRRITRREHEDVLEKMQRRLDETPEASKWRRQTVEHVFGTLKMWAGATHFVTKTLPKNLQRAK